MLLNREMAKRVDLFLSALKTRTTKEFNVIIDGEQDKIYIPFLGKKLDVAIFEEDVETLAEKSHMVMSQYVFDLIKTNENFDMICEFWNSKSSTLFGRLSGSEESETNPGEPVEASKPVETKKASRKKKK